MHFFPFRRLTATLGIASLFLPSLADAATLLYVTSGSGDRVTIYNTDDGNEEVGRVTVGDQPIGMIISGTGAYVANSLSDTVSVIDVTNNQLTATIAVGDSPHSMAVSGTGLYVTNVTDGTVTVIDTADNQVVTTITVGGGPRNIATGGTGAYVANYADDTVSVIDITDNQVVATVSVGDRPHGVGINGTGVYVTNLGSNTVSIIDRTDNQVVTAFAVGSQPEGVAFYGTGAYVTNYNGDTVSVIDTTDNQPVKTISMGDGPTFVRINGTGAYVTNYLGGTVSVIDVTTNTVDQTVSTTQPFDVAFYEDSTTLAPVLTAPASGASSSVCYDLTLTYSLPETPLSDTVKLIFLNTGTSVTSIATLTNGTGTTFSLDLENITGTANVVSSSTNAIAAGSYVVTLEYRDQFGNAAANDTANLTVTSCASNVSSSGTASGGGGVRASTLKARQEKAAHSFSVPAYAPAGSPRQSLLQLRTCDRVMRWFRNDAKMLGRVNERLLKRFGFECR